MNKKDTERLLANIVINLKHPFVSLQQANHSREIILTLLNTISLKSE